MKFEQLVGAVVHDLKNQLQSLLDYEQRALSNIPEQYHTQLQPILQRTNRLKNDALQLITLYRFDGNHMAENGHFPMDDGWPRDTVNDAIEAIALQFPQLVFINDIDGDCQGFFNDNLLQLALVTLITNSAQAGASEIHFSADDSDGLRIILADNGPGFSDQQLDNCQRGHSNKDDGTGLGLYFVELIAEHHQRGQSGAGLDAEPLKGSVTLRNGEIGGAEIELWLP